MGLKFKRTGVKNLARVVMFAVNKLMTDKITKNFIYFILSSEINVYQKWIKVIFSLQN